MAESVLRQLNIYLEVKERIVGWTVWTFLSFGTEKHSVQCTLWFNACT